MKRGESSGTNWWMTLAGIRCSASWADPMVPDVTRTLKSFDTIRSISGMTAAISPTLAPCTQTSGPAGLATLVSPNRSDIRSGCSLPRLRRCESSVPASGVAAVTRPR